MRICAALGTIALACGPRVDVASDTTSGSTTGAATTEITSDGTSSTTSTSSTSSTTSTTGDTSTHGDSSSDDGDEGPSFITPNPDGGGAWSDCDIWAQNCPRGSKCMPWANDGGGAWNATRCAPIDDDPKGVGETCSVVESSVSGIDDCEMGAMCWDVDGETNIGECVAMCHGTAMNPLCTDPCDTCQMMNEGVLIVCLPSCNPLVSDCRDGQVCYPSAGGFACFPDVQSDAGPGDPCSFWYDCDPGNFCAPLEDVPTCEGDDGCCVRFCDVDSPDECNSIEGTTCVPWFEPGRGPAKSCGATTEIGACVLPR